MNSTRNTAPFSAFFPARPRGWQLALLLAIMLRPFCAALAQAVPTENAPAKRWAERATQHQLKIQAGDGRYALYKLHKIDNKGNTTKLVLETPDGTLSRLLAINGQPLAADQNRAESVRLQQLPQDTKGRAKHRRREQQDNEHASQLIQLIPGAFLWSYAPEQSLSGYPHKVVVLDFQPAPGFDAPMREAIIYRSLAGRVWIDAGSGCVVRLEARLFQDVNFGWGLLARIYKGGSVAVEQTDIGQQHWELNYFEMHVSGKALLFKSLNYNIQMKASDFELLPHAPKLAEGIQLLQQAAGSFSIK
jgi:hypothetical protein